MILIPTEEYAVAMRRASSIIWAVFFSSPLDPAHYAAWIFALASSKI